MARTVTVLAQEPSSGSGTPAWFKVNNGYILAGNLVINNSTLYQYFIKLNNNGNVEGQSQEVPIDVGNFVGYREIFEVNGGYVISGRGSNKELVIGLNTNGTYKWDVIHASDLPSNTLVDIQVGLNGQYIWTANRNNQQAQITKVNVSNGAVDRYNLTSILAQGGDYRLAINWLGFILTSDGGLVSGYTYNDTGDGLNTKYEYGKISSNGNLEWVNRFNEARWFQAVLETDDGGFLFFEDDVGGIFGGNDHDLSTMKLTSDGELTPTCGDGGGGGGENELACDMNYSFSGGTLTISGTGFNAGHVILKVFGPSWNTEFSCSDNCGSNVTLNGLSSGTYHISIATYNNNWQPICNELIDINLGSATLIISQPVDELFFFNAAKNGRKANLNWVVNNSHLTDYFVVERSIDGDQFMSMEEVSILADSDQELYYQLADNNPSNGFNYYRIKQVFLDGSIRYSQMKQVIFTVELSDVVLFPNPATNEVNIHLHDFAGEPAQFVIYDQLGQVMKVIPIGELTEEAVRISVRELQSGFYQMVIQVGDSKMISKKLIISKL